MKFIIVFLQMSFSNRWVDVQRGQSYSCGEVASLALVGHSSSDCISIKLPYEVVVLLHQPVLHPIFFCRVS